MPSMSTDIETFCANPIIANESKRNKETKEAKEVKRMAAKRWSWETNLSDGTRSRDRSVRFDDRRLRLEGRHRLTDAVGQNELFPELDIGSTGGYACNRTDMHSVTQLMQQNQIECQMRDKSHSVHRLQDH